ncbi:MAG: hypothetical protein BSOLF_1430 [Candidatus Carbobacillus altaicus]|uniref:Uncharacterized protein n=1 Tax=Candidatus Carbonibacillus altaicus TaxID=2163959 RepID=A0A2R6XZG8_9BACL|nr:MAG: hypothetical protein BSOLF_1430 [Candidatus Carbobacillus altaicus]
MYQKIDRYLKAAKKFVGDVKRIYAKHILENGDSNQCEKGQIYLRTKSKRVKKKRPLWPLFDNAQFFF